MNYMSQKEIKNINKRSLAKITALIYGLVGFIMALIIAIANLTNIMRRQDFTGSVVLATLFNVGIGLFLGVLSALLTALIGWIFGYLTAGIYNWFSGKVGGIKIELADEVEIKPEERNAETPKNLS